MAKRKAKTKKAPQKAPQKAKKKKAAPKRSDKTSVRGRIDKGGKRWYTDEERLSALAALTANGGNVEGTAKTIGIPMQTLWAWSKGHRFPQALQLRNEKNGDLATACEELAWLLASVVPEKIEKAPLNHITTAFGTLVDKSRLLRGEPTSYGRNENVNTNANIDFARLDPDERAVFAALLTKLRSAPDGGASAESGGTRQLAKASPPQPVSRPVPAVLG
jgi:transposase-like protein